jgi:hypothetical protein
VDIDHLLPLLKKLPTQGLGVFQFEAIKIQCSLRFLQNQMKAEHMYLFGKVLGDIRPRLANNIASNPMLSTVISVNGGSPTIGLVSCSQLGGWWSAYSQICTSR